MASKAAGAAATGPAHAHTLHLGFVDLLRAGAAQFIVWHHFASYGPLADAAAALFPAVLEWLHDHARLAVHAFLALGGFLTARHLDRLERPGWRGYARELARRYVRLGGPYLALLAIAVGANALAGQWIDHPVISPPPTVSQVLAHLAFLQDLLEQPALSTGVWYVAIDFQLFALALALWWLAHAAAPRCGLPARSAAMASLAVLGCGAVLWFNRDPGLDHLAVYFFGSYYCGMVAWWAVGKRVAWPLLAWVSVVMLAEWLAWRARLVVGCATGLALLAALAWCRSPAASTRPWRVVGYLGRTSFSLFLVHFPVYLLVSAWLGRTPVTAETAVMGMLAAWALSLLCADLLYRTVELPSLSLSQRLSPSAAADSARG